LEGTTFTAYIDLGQPFAGSYTSATKMAFATSQINPLSKRLSLGFAAGASAYNIYTP
jgi:hypothetical protein